MSRTDRASIQLRVQEVINNSPAGITARSALLVVLAERFKDDAAGLLEYAASVSESSVKGLRKRTYELPENGDALFEIPPVIGISTPDGDLFVPRETANLGQVRQWVREGDQHHSTQSLRFKRFGAEIEPLKEEPDELPWWSARSMLCSGPEADA